MTDLNRDNSPLGGAAFILIAVIVIGTLFFRQILEALGIL